MSALRGFSRYHTEDWSCSCWSSSLTLDSCSEVGRYSGRHLGELSRLSHLKSRPVTIRKDVSFTISHKARCRCTTLFLQVKEFHGPVYREADLSSTKKQVSLLKDYVQPKVNIVIMAIMGGRSAAKARCRRLGAEATNLERHFTSFVTNRRLK